MFELSNVLPLGHCRVSSEKEIIQRRRKLQTEDRPNSALKPSTVVTIFDNADTFLCKVSNYSDCPKSIIWNTSVRLISTSLREQFTLREIVEVGIFPMFTLERNGCSTNQTSAKLLPLELADKTTNIMAEFPGTPFIPSSLVFRMKSAQSTNKSPLQLSCIKRQLAGLHLVYSNEITTLVAVKLKDEIVEIELESIICRKIDLTTISLLLVMPSSQITIIDAQEEDQPRHVAASISEICKLSDASRHILNTIEAINTVEGGDIPRTFLLSGPPGVGKTYSIKSAIQTSNIPINSVFLRGSAILSSSETSLSQGPESFLAQQFFLASKKTNDYISLIFLDECDALMSSQPMVAMLTLQLDNVANHWKRIIVVAATNKPASIPSPLRRPGRFDRELIIHPPKLQERLDLLVDLVGDTVNGLSELAEITFGYVPADLHALVRRARMISHSTGQDMIAALRTATNDVGASALRDASLSKPPKTVWGDIAGDAGGAKTALVQAIEWPRTKKIAFTRLGLTPPRGILLHGPPGCAKTTLARAAAGSESVAFLSLSPADVFASSFVGEAEAVIRRAFATARAAAPCILFMDELDAVLASNSDEGSQMHRSGGNSAESRVLSTFLNEMDGVTSKVDDGVLVVGATNRPSTLDAALLRPGRFDKIIYVPPPDFQGRLAILKAQKFQNLEEKDMLSLANDEISGCMTGAEIVSACHQASIQLLQEEMKGAVLSSDTEKRALADALNSIKPLLSDDRILQQYFEFEKQRSKS